MAQEYINCPKCGSKIEISEAISSQLEQRLRGQLGEEYKNQFLKEKQELERRARKAAEDSLSVEMADLKAQLGERSKKLEVARTEELVLRKRQRELEERQASMQLEIARTLDAERDKIRQEAATTISEEHRLKDAEKEKQLADMKKQIEELKRKAEQGSQQMQGEVLELELEAILQREFPFDKIEPVAKGTRGGDVMLRVHTQTGRFCGTILWETKRTKIWSDGWIEKLKDDQREAKADIAVIVSEALPKGFSHFRQVGSVWITDFNSAIGLALALRMSLIEVAKAREALVGKNEKMELVYNYLTSHEFRNRIEAIVESFKALQGDLVSEKAAMEKVWARREKQITRIIANMSGMYGDIEGLSGTSLPSVKILELPQPEDDR
ncbi:MAG: DUF2130 domain-containing protein [Elusimicrobia bacterium]|nr:DUF2130 domain-containing protein [Elusimicrobiota bacterium]